MFAACVNEEGLPENPETPSGGIGQGGGADNEGGLGGEEGAGNQGGTGSEGGVGNEDGEIGGDEGGEIEEPQVWEQWNGSPYEVGNVSLSKVGYYAEYLGTVGRKTPQVKNGGLSKYPAYGTSISLTQEERQAVLDENNALNAGASYDSMDANGYLYLNGQKTGGVLYKHTAAAGLYEGDVSDSEPAIVKRISMLPHGRGNNITGLYAPAGEVVTIEMTDEDLAKTGGLKVTIGQAFAKGNGNNIWVAKNFTRMPCLANTMTISGNIGYAGSFLGGPIYIEPINKDERFTVTISGAVAYSHYIYGYTTPEEFERNAASTAPYFDLEVWDDGVRHSGPKARVAEYSYADLTRAAELWQKIALVSNKTPVAAGCFSATEGITFLYDPFIAAGAMVAFVNHNGVNCTLSSMKPALDAEQFTIDPSNFWGVLHEYNHNYQDFGMRYDSYGGATNEVTNNVINIVEYSLFSAVSALRSDTGANGGSYSDNWSRYTNPEWVLRQTLARSGRNAELDAYINIMNSFGQDIFMKATNVTKRNSDDEWFASVSAHTGYNMRYYMKDLLQAEISDEMLARYSSGPMYVPVASVYQTGASYLVDGEKHYSRTAQPYVIEAGKPYELDFNENIVIPNGFSWKIKSFTAPANGSIQKAGENVYRYTPSGEDSSGKMYLTLAITKEDGAFEVEDVDLVIELSQGHIKKNVLTRTVYTYESENMYSDAQAAYEAGFAGFTDSYTEDNVNSVQNGNFEIWDPNPSDNAVMVVDGKYIAPQDGKYRIALRGRQNVAMYISTDGGTSYGLGGFKKNGSGADYYPGDSNAYTDLTLSAGEEVYIKAVLVVKSGGSKAPYIGIGVGMFNASGNVGISHMNAVRTSYEETEREYYDAPALYEPQYYVNHNELYETGQTLISSRYAAWDNSYSIDNLFDANKNNFIHSNKTNVSAENPFEIVVELNEAVTANAFTIIGEPSRQYQPKDFKLYAGESEEGMALLVDADDAPKTGNDVVVTFPLTKVKYFKLVVTDTYATGADFRYIAFRGVRFGFSLGAGELISPAADTFTYRGEWTDVAKPSVFGKALRVSDGSVTFKVNGSFALLGEGAPEIYADGVKMTPSTSDGVDFYVVLPHGEHEITIGSNTLFDFEGLIAFKG